MKCKKSYEIQFIIEVNDVDSDIVENCKDIKITHESIVEWNETSNRHFKPLEI